MNLIERIQTVTQQRQAWPIGAGMVNLGDATWGHAQDTYSPPEYGDYITSSNPVYACAQVRARLLASLPLKAYRNRPRLGKQEVDGGPLVDLLHTVNPSWTLPRLIQQTELSLCLWGHCPWFLERGTSGRLPPREIWWGRPDYLRPLVDETKYIIGYQFYPPNAGTPIPFDATEVVWFRYPNPVDEFAGLAPMAAARLAADYASAAMKANKALFEHGLHMGGVVSLADKAQVMTTEQASELSTLIDKRFRGTDNAHRWMVLRAALNIQGLSITPKDADYLGGLKQSLEEVCRAFGIPQDLIGGQRSYENVNAAMRAVWTQTIVPEATFFAAELTEQLLPLFPGAGIDFVEFDTSEVEELREEETESWTRWKEQITAGAVTLNEWRQEQGKDALPWGDVWWAQSTLVPIENAEVAEPEPPPPMLSAEDLKQLLAGEEAVEGEATEVPAQLTEGEAEPEEATPEEAPRALLAAPQRRGVAYDSDQHRALWQRFVVRTESQEKRVADTVAELFRRQQASILDKLRGRGLRSAADLAEVPFDMARWKRDFRVAIKGNLRDIVADAGQDAIVDLGLGLGFDVVNPAVLRFIERRAQRFAVEVNETTWDALRKSLSVGIEAGEDLDVLADRVQSVMADRIRSSKDVIARTEVVGAQNGGTLQGWEQAQNLIGPLLKHWVAALDERTRDSHIAAHNRYNGEDDGIPLERDFEIGDGSGPAPGQIGLPEEDCNCRCTITAEPAPF